MDPRELAAEYMALKAANDQLRERGKQWLWNALDARTAELSRHLSEKPGGVPLQTGRQEWQFKADNATMVGERYGARYRGHTLVVEVGWPRLPEHGFITGSGLARGRIGISRNTMLDAETIAELILKRQATNGAAWFLFANRQLGERLSEPHLDSYLHLLLSD